MSDKTLSRHFISFSMESSCYFYQSDFYILLATSNLFVRSHCIYHICLLQLCCIECTCSSACDRKEDDVLYLCVCMHAHIVCVLGGEYHSLAASPE